LQERACATGSVQPKGTCAERVCIKHNGFRFRRNDEDLMLYLASQSPRRKQLLEQLGVAFEVLHVEVPEIRRPGESAGAYVSRVAHEKAIAGFAAVHDRDEQPCVLGADTEVVLDDRVFGKPRDAEDAAAMLRALSGRTHRVISTVWCVDASKQVSANSVSEVRFAALDEAAIAAYVATGEPFGKAGAYAIQGRAAAFIEHLSGSYSGVMGLPLHETARLLQESGP
jgi:septum formation protein